MARKKKKREEPENNDKKAQATNIGYSGKLEVSVKNGGKTISSHTYHNAGMNKLFRFLCYALAGEYRQAEYIRPFKIKLFNGSGEGPDITEEPSVSDPVSAFVSINKPATVNLNYSESPTAKKKSAVTLHFLVPYSAISGNRICLICLYGADVFNDDEDYSAYFYLTKKGATGAYVWDPIEISEQDKLNYSLTLEWTMTFENATAQQ